MIPNRVLQDQILTMLPIKDGIVDRIADSIVDRIANRIVDGIKDVITPDAMMTVPDIVKKQIVLTALVVKTAPHAPNVRKEANAEGITKALSPINNRT